MSRERTWKDRRAWVESDAKKLSTKHRKRLAWWRVIIGFFSPKRKEKWARENRRQNENIARYITKKLSHDLGEKVDRDEWTRAQNQVKRARRRHEAWIAANPAIVESRKKHEIPS